MVAPVRTKPALRQRTKHVIVAALLALSMITGIATSTQSVGATRYCYQHPFYGKTCVEK